MSRKILIVEDDISHEYIVDSTVIWWNKSCANGQNCISITQYVENNSDYFKTKYLEWNAAFLKSKVGDITLEKYYQIEKGISFFWFTSLGQRCNIVEKSQINNAIKLLALEDIIKEFCVDEVVLLSNSNELIATIQDYCQNGGIKFKKLVFKSRKVIYFKINYLSHLIKSIAYLIYFILIRSLKSKTQQDNASVAFFDMFLNVKISSQNTHYKSHYWGGLPEFLEKRSISVLWSHFFYRHKAIPNTRIANRICEKLNSLFSLHHHSIVDSKITFKIICTALRHYLIFFIKSLTLRDKKKIFYKSDISGFNFYILFRKEFNDSCYGIGALRNFLYLELIEVYVASLSHKKIGFYIQENQPWETMLIYLWRKYNHGLIIGVPHSTVRYWDMRYFYHRNAFFEAPSINLPIPDFIAVNSPIAEKYLLSSNVPSQLIKKVEALRYMHLQYKQTQEIHLFEIRTILICGDFLLETNKKMFTCIYDAVKIYHGQISLVFKPHPGTPVPTSYYKNLNVIVREETLEQLINEVDIVFTSNISSSAVDAYIYGKPLIQYIDMRYFNMSPLRGIDGVNYVSDGSELAYLLNKGLIGHKNQQYDYFYNDPTLNKWQSIINTHII